MIDATRFFDSRAVDAWTAVIRRIAEPLGRRVTIMEVCGTHTHAIAAAGLRHLMPECIRLVAGPGCPVCVTPVDYLDRAIALSALPDVTLCTFGDLMRVPSSTDTLEQLSARGRDIRVVYAPRDAVAVARAEPGRRVVFLGVGFETTLPTVAAAIEDAEREDVPNFLVLPGAKLIEPPLRALVADDEVDVDGFLLPGHVSVIVGADFYRFLVEEFAVPSAIVGFTPVDILSGVAEIVRQLAAGSHDVVNLYGRVVRRGGNPAALQLMRRFFVPCDTRWRGLGAIPGSGLAMRDEFAHRDAARIDVEVPAPREPKGCRCGDVLKGVIEPPECPLYGRACNPDRPMGACMVSSEGTCAAWFRHERPLEEALA